jgi:inorganic pyrophosphatase
MIGKEPFGMANLHLVNDVEYKENNTHTMVVEIPAGTNEKWQTSALTGSLYFEHVDGKPRVIQYLPYPFNYGFIPQTLHSKEHGGDGDPLDVVLIGPALQRGSIQQLKILGAIKFKDDGEEDTKVLGVAVDGPFADLDDIEDLLLKYYGALEIIRLWFEGYKGPGSLFFQGYARRDEALEIIESAHKDWTAETGYGQTSATLCEVGGQ